MHPSDRQTTAAPRDPTAVAHRRQPVQERARQRVQMVLDTAREIIQELGYEAVTTRRIAERSGIPVAGVYHYFADRDSVLDALVLAHIEANRVLMEDYFRTASPATWQEAVDALIDRYARYWRANPDFRVLWAGRRFSRRLEEVDRRRNVGLANALADYFAPRMPTVSRKRLAPIFANTIAIVDALLEFAYRWSENGNTRTIGEAKVAAKAYLAAAIGESTRS